METSLHIPSDSSWTGAAKEQRADDPRDRMFSEILSTKDSARQPARAAELQGLLGETMSHLTNAQNISAKQGIVAAVSEYRAAINSADRLDQREITREREEVASALRQDGVSNDRRRALVQQDAELVILQRAPGVARANFAIALLKNGDFHSGTEMLFEAQQKDPELGRDGQFKVFFADALKSVPDLHPGIMASGLGSRSDTRTPGAGEGLTRPADAPAVPPMVSSNPTDGTAPRVSPPAPTDATAPVAAPPPADSSASGGNKRQLASTPVESVIPLTDAVTKTGSMTDAVKQAFQQAIDAADAHVSPKAEALMQQELVARQAILNPVYANKEAVDTQNSNLQSAIMQLPTELQQKAADLANLMESAPTLQERSRLEQQLASMAPDKLGPILQRRDDALGDQYIRDRTFYNAVDIDLQAELNQRALTRLAYGQALAINGDISEAKNYLADAIKVNHGVDPVLNETLAQIAMQMRVTPEQGKLKQSSDGTSANSSQENSRLNAAAETLSKAVNDFGTLAGSDGTAAASALKQTLPEFMLAQKNADEDFVQTVSQIKQLAAEIDKKMTPDVQADLEQLRKIDLSKLSSPDVVALKTYEDPQTSQEQRREVGKLLSQSAPELTALLDRVESKLGRETLDKIRQLDVDNGILQSALLDRYGSRMQFANCAVLAGNTDLAREQFVGALGALPSDLQVKLVDDKNIQDLAVKLNFDLKTVPVAPDSVLAQVSQLQGGPERRATAGGDSTEQSDPASVSRPETAGKGEAFDKNSAVKSASDLERADNFGLRPDQIETRAWDALSRNDFKEAEAHLRDAIKTADASFTPAEREATKQCMEVVRTGKKRDGSPLTEDERGQIHKLINMEFAKAAEGIKYRDELALVLNSQKQYASAEQVHKDEIAHADKLPIDLMQAECSLLTSDLANNKFSSDAANKDSKANALKVDMQKLVQVLQGTGISKDDGLLYLPIVARKSAAQFYVGGSVSPEGLVKPELAMGLVDEIKKKEKELYNIDESQLKEADPSLANLVQVIHPLLPKDLKEEKRQKDSFWSNVLVDVGSTSAVVAALGIVASIATRNPEVAKIVMNGEKLSRVGMGLAAAGAVGAVGAEIGLRHGLNQAVTGQEESWKTSAIHGAAGIGSLAAMLGTRAAVGKLLYGGASAEAVVPRMAQKFGLVAEGETSTIGDFVQKLAKTDRLSPDMMRLKDSSELLIVDGKPNPALTQVMDSTYSQAQLTELSSAYRPAPDFSNASTRFEKFKVGSLAAAETAGDSLRGLASGWATGVSALSSYGLISALDRPVDPITGKQQSYLEALRQSQYRSPWENVGVDALWMAIMPGLKDGAVAKRLFAEDASLSSKAWSAVQAPITAPFSTRTFGSLGRAGLASSEYWKTGLQVAQLNANQAVFNAQYWLNGIKGALESRQIGEQIHKQEQSITNQSNEGAI